MEFWKKNIETFRIEDSDIYEAQILRPDYKQERGLTYPKLKKLRTEWQKILPKLDNLKYLYLSHTINQDYFETICKIPNLKGLFIHNSKISNFSSIGNLTKLEELHFCGSLGISTLDGIQNLTKLKFCVLDKFFGIESVNEMSNLLTIEKLHLFAGLHGQKLNLKSIEPISELKNLKELALDIKTNIDIRPLLRLEELELLILPDYYHSKIKNELPKRTELR